MDAQAKRLLQQKTIEAIKAPDSDRPLRPTSLLAAAGAIVEQGGATSGNFKHAGIPKTHGGSKPGGGHSRIGVKPGASKEAISKKVGEHRFVESRKRARAAEKQAKKPSQGAQDDVGDALDTGSLPRRGKGQAVRETIEAIDQVHTDGNLDQSVAVELENLGSDDGIYRHFGAFTTNIGVSEHTITPRLTAAHEIGHMLDHKGLTGRKSDGTFASQNTRGRSAELTELMGTIDGSKAVDSIAKTKGKTVKRRIKGQMITLRASDALVDYMLDPTEKFARAYSQYIAVKSKNPGMLKELREQRKRDSGGRFKHQTQWSNQDFKPIETVFDKLFEAEGWSR